MTEEQQSIEQPVETQAETPVAPEQPHVEAPAPVTWQDELAKLDPKEFRRILNQHDKLAGVMGYELQQARAAERAKLEAEARETAERQATERLQEMAKSDPVAFADTWLSEAHKKETQRQLDGLRGSERQKLASDIGRAYQGVPEWAELTVEDHEELARQLIGKSDDEILPIWVKHAHIKTGTLYGKKLHEKWKAEELAKEREAIRAEEAAKLLKTSDGPDVNRPKGPATGVNIQGMKDDEFDAYYRQRFGR